MNTKYAVSTYGSKITLSSDDTFTLQIHYGRERIESTPQMLADRVVPASLLRIATSGGDCQDRKKAAEALRIWINSNFD
jgi:hypothetical protein